MREFHDALTSNCGPLCVCRRWLRTRVEESDGSAELRDCSTGLATSSHRVNGLGSDLTGLGADNIDLERADRAFLQFRSARTRSARARRFRRRRRMPLPSLVNMSFGVSVDKIDEDGAALIFLGGENGARPGDLDICVRYRDTDGDFDTSTSTDPNGAMLVTGRWSLLNDHSLTLSVDVVGGVRPLLLKSVGVSGAERKYRFDFGGDLSEWTGSPPGGIHGRCCSYERCSVPDGTDREVWSGFGLPLPTDTKH